jgi:hypothetical protein
MLIIVKLFLRFAVATCISIQPNSRETRAIERAKAAGRRLGGERGAAELARRRRVAASVKPGRRKTVEQQRCVTWMKMCKKNHAAAMAKPSTKKNHAAALAKKSYKKNHDAALAKDSYKAGRTYKSAAPVKRLIESGVLKVSSRKNIKKCVYKYCFHSQRDPSTKEVPLGLTKDGYWTIKGKEQYGYPQLLRSLGSKKQGKIRLAAARIMVKIVKNNNWVTLYSILYKKTSTSLPSASSSSGKKSKKRSTTKKTESSSKKKSPVLNNGRWSLQEKALFAKGRKKWGDKWVKIAQVVKTRDNKACYSHSLTC